MENGEMVLEQTRGRMKELTKVSDDRNSKERQLSSCEAVLQYENIVWRFTSMIAIHYYFDPYEIELKSSLKLHQLAGHKEKLL